MPLQHKHEILALHHRHFPPIRVTCLLLPLLACFFRDIVAYLTERHVPERCRYERTWKGYWFLVVFVVVVIVVIATGSSSSRQWYYSWSID